MSERPGESQPVAGGHHDLVWDDLPEHERSIVEADLPSLQRWIREHPEVAAAVELDRSAFDAGQGHVLLVATMHGDPGAVRSELESVVAHPDRLRVRADRPTAGELRRLLRWIRVEAEPSNPQLLVPPRSTPRDPSR